MDHASLQILLDRARTTNDRKLLALLDRYISSPLFQDRPRPDQPDKGDQQHSFVTDKFDGIAVALGGNGAGKNFAAALKVARFLLNTPPPEPYTPFWVLSKSYDMVCRNCWAKNLSRYITPEYIEDVKWYRKSTGWPHAVILKKHRNGNQFVIEFKSSDQEKSRLMGDEIAGFHIDEQMPVDVILEVWARCRRWNYPGSKLYTLTPLMPDPKLEEIYHNLQDYSDWRFYRLNSACNDKLVEGFMDRLLQSEIEELRDTRLKGDFASFSGQVYRQFDQQVHVVEPFEIPEIWWKFRGLDFGFADKHPLAMVWIARDPEGRYYIYHEHYASKLSVDEHLEAINAVKWDAASPYYGPTYYDAAAPMLANEFSIRDGAIDGLLPARKGRPKEGIAVVQKLLRDRRLFVFSTCKNTINEFKTYSWHPLLDEPKKEHDHTMDALRYSLTMEAFEFLECKPLAVQRPTTRMG